MSAPSGGREDALARDDRQLIERIATGDDEAFAELYDRFGARAHRVALAVSRDDGRAEDAVQEAFISVWRSPGLYRSARGTVASWVLTVVRNRAIDLSRRTGTHRDPRADADLLATSSTAEDVAAEAIANADAPRLRALLAQLPDAQQEVIVLAFYGQLTHTAIARHLDLPAGTVKGRLRLGLRKLRAEIDQPSHSQGSAGQTEGVPPLIARTA